MEGRTELGTQRGGSGLMRGRAWNPGDDGNRRGGGKEKFARYRETLRMSRPVSRGLSFIIEGGFARIPVPPPHLRRLQRPGGLLLAFLRHRGIHRSDRAWLLKNLGRDAASRWSGPGQVKQRAGRNASCPWSAMSSDRLFLDRHARQHCPSPLHRHDQTTTHFSPAWAKGDISTLP